MYTVYGHDGTGIGRHLRAGSSRQSAGNCAACSSQLITCFPMQFLARPGAPVCTALQTPESLDRRQSSTYGTEIPASMPETIPIHMDVSGGANGYGSRNPYEAGRPSCPDPCIPVWRLLQARISASSRANHSISMDVFLQMAICF